ncbi:MAG: DUF4445 domain-containing protein [Armatimonadetes bacterium]|nr:DUF4445 domain-containing protein [Armatimonadota bacterium]
MTGKIRAEFGPGGEVAFVDPETLVVEAAALAGVELQTPCGGKGKCGQCRVVTAGDGLTPPDEVEVSSLSEEDLAKGVRLSCRARIVGPTQITIPAGSRITTSTILETGLVDGVPAQPNVRRAELALPKPALGDQRADLRRITAGLGAGLAGCEADLDLLRELPERLRESDFAPVAVTIGNRLVDIRGAGGIPQAYGCAVDIGTTTVVAYVVELESGHVVGTGSAPNPQGAHGADVVSRVEFADQTADGLQTLHEESVGIVNRVIAEACGEADVSPRDVYEVTVVGNTCMAHLFLGLNPHYVARAPYIPVVDQPLRVSAAELGVRVNPRGEVYVLPNVAGWVGADTVGVVLSTRLRESEGPTLAIDIGTNGEVMLWSGERLLVCSTAAGPAFEGAQIRHGMRAAAGAIDHVRATEDGIAFRTIGNQPAVGICGSGLLDAVARMLDLGVINPTGLMVDEAGAAQLPPAIASRIAGKDQDRHFVLATVRESGLDEPIILTQRDVRQLQLAKGAIRAGIEVLLAETGLRPADLERILLAGAFGSYIDRVSAVRIGLVPSLPLAQIIAVGNAAGAGAVMALASTSEREKATQLAEAANHVELSSRPDFQMLFMETMLFQSG